METSDVCGSFFFFSFFFNALHDEQWKCDMIFELTDFIYGFGNCGLSYEEAKYCLCNVAAD